MKHRDKLVASFLIILLWSLFLSGCAASNQSVKDAKAGWSKLEQAGQTFGSTGKIFICEYTSKSKLFPSADLEYVALYNDIPSAGKVIIYDTGKVGFDDLYAVFYTSSGVIDETFSYKEWDALYEYYFAIGSSSIYKAAELEKALICISTCNYISGMYNHAYDESEETNKAPGKLESNKWYQFSEKQMSAVSSGSGSNLPSSGKSSGSLSSLISFSGGNTSMLWVPFLSLVIIFVIKYIVARKFEAIAEGKGYTAEQAHPFAMCFWLGIIGMIYVLALPDKKALAVQEEILRELRNQPAPGMAASTPAPAAPAPSFVPGKVVPVTEDKDELPEL